MNTHRKRLSDLETVLRPDRDRSCGLCHGSGHLLLAVPEDVTPDDPAYLPETCPKCGVPVRNVLQIIGMTQQEIA